MHLILCELFITLGRGSDPKNAISGLLLLSKKLPKIALSQLVRSGFSFGNAEFLWKHSLDGMVSIR